MKILQIRNNTLLFDDEDIEKIKGYRIDITKSRNNYFAGICINGLKSLIQRYILNFPDGRIKFKDGNRFNFQKSNLIIILNTQETKKEYRKQWYSENKEYVNEKARIWQKANPDKYKQIQKKCREKNKEQLKNHKKEYRARPEVKAKYNKYYITKRREIHYKYMYTKKKSKERKLDFDLTEEQYINLVDNLCYYCQTSYRKECGTGLDRIDNKKGYVNGNVLPCCGSCNKTRGDRFTVKETKVMIDALMEYRKCSNG